MESGKLTEMLDTVQQEPEQKAQRSEERALECCCGNLGTREALFHEMLLRLRPSARLQTKGSHADTPLPDSLW